MGWLERWRQRREQRRERKETYARARREVLERKARLIALPPEELAEKVAASDLSARVPTDDMPRLAGRIALLPDADRYRLGRAAEGDSEEQMARQEFLAVTTVSVCMKRILTHLHGEEAWRGPAS
jgi:hypothetical protein